MKDEIIDFFGWYNLYDTPILALRFDFENQNTELVLENYDDRKKESIELKLLFKKVSKYVFEYPSDSFVFEMRAIYRATVRKINENHYELNLLIDMPEIKKTHGRQHEITVGKMLIVFVDLEIVGGLDREAMEYKYKIAEK